MATHRYDPYLWVHLAGITTVPLWLALCTLGLAVGSPHWPGLELALLSLVGITPALAMQLGQPFYIFSLLALTLKPTALSDDQRRMLTLFQQWWVKGLAVIAPVPLVWLLWEIYPRAVVASDITPFTPWGRLGGLAVAAGSFAMANLFLQVPVSVLAVMATSDKRFKRTAPYPLNQVSDHFTQTGIPLNRLLPEVLPPDGALPADQEVLHPATVLQKPEGARVDASVTSDLREPAQLEPDFPKAESTDSEAPLADTTAITDALEAETLDIADAHADDADTEVLEDDPEALDTVVLTIDDVDVLTEAADAGSQGADNWDHDDEPWEQTTHDWDQTPAWETAPDAAKDRTVEVAVVRISDPS